MSHTYKCFYLHAPIDQNVNFSPQNNGAHGKVIPQLGVSYSIENKQGRQCCFLDLVSCVLSQRLLGQCIISKVTQ